MFNTVGHASHHRQLIHYWYKATSILNSELGYEALDLGDSRTWVRLAECWDLGCVES